MAGWDLLFLEVIEDLSPIKGSIAQCHLDLAA
jgi:hypothetical protein